MSSLRKLKTLMKTRRIIFKAILTTLHPAVSPRALAVLSREMNSQ